jgi:hypothetical protein
VNELADYFLFLDEAPLPVPLTARPGFAERLALRIPKDCRGRSCGQLELARRLLRYPCSYMVCSGAFDALLPEVKTRVYGRMVDVLSVDEPPVKYLHRPAEDRRAILEILIDTKPDFPRVH